MITRVHSASIVVADQDAALAFYVDTLGWEKRDDMAVTPTYRWLTVAPAAGGAEIALEPSSVLGRTPGGYTGISLNATNLESTFAELSAKGAKFVNERGEPVTAVETLPWGAKGAWLTDPDGNVLFIVEDARPA